MGWGRTLFLGDIGNRLDIEDTEQDIQRLRGQVLSAHHNHLAQERKVDLLMRENAELKLYLAAILRLLRAKGLVTATEISDMVKAVDGEDGTVDGAHTGSVV
jgi:hypothetical protein